MKKYLITDPFYYTSTLENFIKQVKVGFQHQVDIACFRDKNSQNIDKLAEYFMQIAREYNIPQVLINTDIDLAIKYNYDGVHLNSTQFNQIKQAKDSLLYTIISTHNDKEIQNAIINGADAITYSPIFNSPNKGETKGIEELKRVVDMYDIPIFALGGIISKREFDILSSIKIEGFASIRYFLD